MKKKKSQPPKAKKKASKIVNDNPVPGVMAALGMEPLPPGTLPMGGIHPAAYEAVKYIGQIDARKISQWAESFASCAISGKNELAEICSETLRRIRAGEPVSDRYLCSLAVIFMLDEIKRLRQMKKTPFTKEHTDLRARVDKARNLLLIQIPK